MSERDKLFKSLVKKSGKAEEEISNLIKEKVDELSGLVSEEGAIYIIANDLGVRLETDKPKKDADMVKIEDITEPKTPVSFMCKVLRKYDRVTFSSSNGSEGSVQSVLAGDETGVIRVVFWNDKTEILENIHDKDILKIINAYTRENNNSERIEVHYGQYSDIEVNPKGVDIKVQEMKSDIDFKKKKINELEEGERNVSIEGIVTDFEIPRFYLACPDCFKKVFQDEGSYKCAEHNDVEPMKVPIVNIIIDDGSGSLGTVSFRDRAEQITKLSKEDIIGLTEDIDKYREFSKKMIGNKVSIGGNVGVSNLTGEKQFLVNQIIGVAVKTVDEVAQELIDEEKSDKKMNTETKSDSSKHKEEMDKKSFDDDMDIDIEEIDIDDDLL